MTKISKIFKFIKNTNITQFNKLSIEDINKTNYLRISVFLYSCLSKNKNAYILVKSILDKDFEIYKNVPNYVIFGDFNKIFSNNSKYSYKIIEEIIKNDYCLWATQTDLYGVLYAITENTSINVHLIFKAIKDNVDFKLINSTFKSKYIINICKNVSINSHILLDEFLKVDNFITYFNISTNSLTFNCYTSLMIACENKGILSHKLVEILISRLKYDDIIAKNSDGKCAFVCCWLTQFNFKKCDMLFPYINCSDIDDFNNFLSKKKILGLTFIEYYNKKLEEGEYVLK